MATSFETIALNLNNAIVADIGSTYLLEDPEAIASLIECTDVDAGLTDILPGEYDWYDACAMLELTPDNNPQRIYRAKDINGQAIYICLESDFDFA